MTRTDRFTSMEAVRHERLRLKAERDARLNDLEGHWANIKSKDFRRGLLMDAVKSVFHPKGGANGLATLAQGVKMASGWLPLVGPLLASRKGVLGSRWLWSAVALAVPFLTKKNGSSPLAEMWERRPWRREGHGTGSVN